MSSLEHVIVLMMENNSFDRMLGALLPERPGGGGIKGTEKNHWNVNPKTGKPVYLTATNTHEVKIDPGHELADVKEQLAGPCKGFVSNYVDRYSGDPQEIMGYYPDGYLPILHDLAKKFTICDRWFSSIPGPTWPNRFFAHTGTSMGYTANTGGPNQYYQSTIYQALLNQGLDCRVYYHDFSQTAALANTPPLDSMTHFLATVSDPKKTLPKFCFIEPHYGILSKQGQNDQHPPSDVFRGEKLIDQVYRALRGNDALWQKSLLVITYDEHGGFYDHVDPPAAVPPDSHTDPNFKFDKLGVRVPTVLVSPWLDQGVIRDTFDHTSLLKFLIDKWGLVNYMGDRVESANTFETYIRKSPRVVRAVSSTAPTITYMPAQEQTPLSDHQKALIDLAATLVSRISDPTIRVPLAREPLNASPEAAALLAIEQFQAFLRDQATQPPAKLKAAIKKRRGRRKVSNKRGSRGR